MYEIMHTLTCMEADFTSFLHESRVFHNLIAPYTVPLKNWRTHSLFMVLSLSGFAVIATFAAAAQSPSALLLSLLW